MMKTMKVNPDVDQLELDLNQRKEAVSEISEKDNCFAAIVVDEEGYLKMHMNTITNSEMQSDVFMEVVSGMTEVMKNAINFRSRKLAKLMGEDEAD